MGKTCRGCRLWRLLIGFNEAIASYKRHAAVGALMTPTVMQCSAGLPLCPRLDAKGLPPQNVPPALRIPPLLPLLRANLSAVSLRGLDTAKSPFGFKWSVALLALFFAPLSALPASLRRLKSSSFSPPSSLAYSTTRLQSQDRFCRGDCFKGALRREWKTSTDMQCQNSARKGVIDHAGFRKPSEVRH
jgi:hypothetical protein